MKAFEDWWEKHKGKCLCKESPMQLKDYWAYPLHKVVWKASLKWVLKRLKTHYYDDFDSLDITKDIRKELRE